jgi:hypothetical protein
MQPYLSRLPVVPGYDWIILSKSGAVHDCILASRKLLAILPIDLVALV